MTILAPAVVGLRRIPGSGLSVMAGILFSPDFHAAIILDTEPVAEVVGGYLPPGTWSFPGMEGREPWRQLRDAVLRASGHLAVDGRFWRSFIRDVEEASPPPPVADVTLR